MKHMHYTDVEEQIPTEEGAKDTTIRWVITDKDGAKNFAMRIITINPGGHTPYHQHDWEHEILVMEGNGVLKSEKSGEPFKPGDVIFIKPGEMHQMRNEGKKVIRVTCLIPYKH